MSSFFLRTMFSFALTLTFYGIFHEGALAQTTRVSCKASGQEYSKAQRNAEKLANQATKTQEMLKKLEELRQRNLQRLDERLKNIATNTATNTAKCFVGSAFTDLFKGKGDYQKCLDRAKRAAEVAAERAVKTKIAIEQQKSRLNANADSKKALLEQKLTRLQGEITTQKATAASAKSRYDACVAAGGIA